MGTEYDVERDSSPGGTQPHSLPKRCVAEQGGDALGGSALGAQSTITQMGHSDSPGSGSIVRDVLFEKSPNNQCKRLDGHVGLYAHVLAPVGAIRALMLDGN